VPRSQILILTASKNIFADGSIKDKKEIRFVHSTGEH